MIPKVIHYCWFGRNPLPETAVNCIESWKKVCSDYQIQEWNESNIDVSKCPVYVQQAYEKKQWAFVTDYVRLLVVYENGGLYFDTDVSLIKSFDCLLEYRAFFGFENLRLINTGEGFGAEKGNVIVKEMLDLYSALSFIKEDGSYNRSPCTGLNTRILINYGLIPNGRRQILQGDILILPAIYLCPIDFKTGIWRHSSKTMSIHWFDSSWYTAEQKNIVRERRKKVGLKVKIQFYMHLIVEGYIFWMIRKIVRRQ